VIVAAFTALRKGELAGLRWEDYDRKKQELNIVRSVYQGEVDTTKTESSRAPVPVIKTVQKALDEHLKRNSGDGYIFHDSNNNPMRFENFTNQQVKPALEKAGVFCWHGLHAFRRFLATTLDDKGVALEDIKDVLRHSSSDVTKASYIKRSTRKFRRLLEMVEKDFVRELENQRIIPRGRVPIPPLLRQRTRSALPFSKSHGINSVHHCEWRTAWISPFWRIGDSEVLESYPS